MIYHVRDLDPRWVDKKGFGLSGSAFRAFRMWWIKVVF